MEKFNTIKVPKRLLLKVNRSFW